MCIIIDNRVGVALPADIIDRSVLLNPDGFGIVFLDNGEVIRTMDMERAKAILSQKRPFVAHCRFATVGGVSKSNVHPFPCHGGWLFQNGTVSGVNTRKKQTDTSAIAEMLDGCSNAQIPKILAGFDSRFCWIDSKGNAHTTGEWKEKNGVQYSKANVLDTFSVYKAPKGGNLVAVYGTLKEGLGNHHHLANADFVGWGDTEFDYRLCVSGLPYLLPWNGKGSPVEMEVYVVDDETLENIDALEGHPYFYEREKISIILDDPEQTHVRAWAYFAGEEYDDGIYYGWYRGRETYV